MILQTLTNYYQRLLDNEKSGVPQFGFEKKEIPFLIILDENGDFVSIRDTRAQEGKRMRARSFLVPRGVKKASGIKANILWDTPKYIFGIPKMPKDGGPPKEKDVLRAKEAKKAFFDKIIEVFGKDSPDIGVQAVLTFLKNGKFNAIFGAEFWDEIVRSQPNLSFVLKSDEQLLICQRPFVMECIKQVMQPSGQGQVCLVTGERDVPAVLHAAIKGVWGAQSSGANIVSFNKESFCSFNYWKKQGLNAPVGQKAEFAYTTAINRLLAKGSRQRIQVGDATTVFWATKPHPFEEDFSCFLGEPSSGQEPDYGKVRALLQSVKTGVLPEDDATGFFVLGLGPNASRIVIRFWYNGTVAELKERIAQHFNDFEIIRSEKDREYLSLFRILISVAPEGKADNIPPNLGGELMRSILTGMPYPRTLLHAAIRRCKAEQRVTRELAAIIKACLNRYARFSKDIKREVSMALDKGNNNIGYVLGRLFAVLERIQEQAHGGTLNKTIRDTYFGAASSSPLVIFRRLNDLSIHHLAKIRNSGGNTTWLEKLVGEVMDKVPANGFPRTLPIEDQGRFAVGYYHQRQDFFIKKED